MEHAWACWRDRLEDRRYKAYVTDALMMLNENVTNAVGGKIMTARWVDAYLPRDDRDGEDIAADVIKGAGLRFRGEARE